MNSDVIIFIVPSIDSDTRKKLAELMLLQNLKTTNSVQKTSVILIPTPKPSIDSIIDSILVNGPEYKFDSLPTVQTTKQTRIKRPAYKIAYEKFSYAKKKYAQRFFNRTNCK